MRFFYNNPNYFVCLEICIIICLKISLVCSLNHIDTNNGNKSTRVREPSLCELLRTLLTSPKKTTWRRGRLMPALSHVQARLRFTLFATFGVQVACVTLSLPPRWLSEGWLRGVRRAVAPTAHSPEVERCSLSSNPQFTGCNFLRLEHYLWAQGKLLE